MKKVTLFFLIMFICVSVNAQTTHIVQRGETLELIANRYGISPKLIKDANPLIDEYYTGLTLSIPPKPKSAISSTREETRRRISSERELRKATIIRSRTHSNAVWGGYSNYYQPIYNPYLNNSQMLWHTQHNQLQATVNAFQSQMMQQAQQDWNQHQANMSDLWNNYNPNIDYSTMFVPVLYNNSTLMDSNSGTSSSNTYSTRSPQTCGACGGKGWIPETKGVASFGLDKWCNECNKKVETNHYHATCPSCKGKGVW